MCAALSPSPRPLAALFAAGYLAPYLLPTIVGRLDARLAVSATQAGAMGSALLLSSASAGFVLASRVDRIGARLLARAGLALAVLGYGGAALTASVPAVALGAVLGGAGSGTAAAVAATGIAAQPVPHRATGLGLLSVSALAGAVFLTVPHLGPGHGLPFAAMALAALAVWPLTGRLAARTADVPLPGAAEPAPARVPRARLRYGLLLVGAMPFWAMAQNALWGVSGRIGVTQAQLDEATVGVVFALALGAGLVGVLAAGALGRRLGPAVALGAGTALIAGCMALSAAATGPAAFAVGEIAWNGVYPVVLAYVISLAASLDARGRWAVLVGSAASLGTAAGPLVGSALAAWAGFPVIGVVLGAGLAVVAVPMTLVAVRTGCSRVPEPVGALDIAVSTPAVPGSRRAYGTAGAGGSAGAAGVAGSAGAAGSAGVEGAAGVAGESG
ncbi:MFS transporter [Streptomyces sp. NPDC093252]|uniref:MFS transporter n=1 Tax=Streptomyces sp. NPDC093252 TaxID=3154980 RepID=UPI003421DA0B